MRRMQGGNTLQVTIHALLTTTEHNPRIAFATPCGEGQGTWVGRAPRVGHRYMAELEIVDILMWGDTIVESDSTGCHIAFENDTVVVDGLLEQIEPAGATDVCTIRLDTSLMMVETCGHAPLAGRYVRLSAPSLQLFDTNL